MVWIPQYEYFPNAQKRFRSVWEQEMLISRLFLTHIEFRIQAPLLNGTALGLHTYNRTSVCCLSMSERQVFCRKALVEGGIFKIPFLTVNIYAKHNNGKQLTVIINKNLHALNKLRLTHLKALHGK